MTPAFFGGSLSSSQFFLDRPNGACLIVDNYIRMIEIYKYVSATPLDGILEQPPLCGCDILERHL